VIAWISDLGPLGGADGEGSYDNVSAFFDLVDGHCDDTLANIGNLTEPYLSVYEGAASACLAAFHNQPHLWQRAQASLTTVGPQTSRLECLEKSVYQLLQSLVEVHRQDPEAQLVKSDTPGNGPNCPRVLELIPDHGPRQGGYQIRLLGVNLPQTAGIHFGDQYLTVTTNGSEAVVTVPPMDEAVPPEYECADVWPEGWPLGADNSRFFCYDSAEFTESAPSTISPPAG